MECLRRFQHSSRSRIRRELISTDRHLLRLVIRAESLILCEIDAFLIRRFHTGQGLLKRGDHLMKQYRDTYRERVLALIDEKRQETPGNPVTSRRKTPAVLDLMDALKRSLAASPKPSI